MKVKFITLKKVCSFYILHKQILICGQPHGKSQVWPRATRRQFVFKWSYLTRFSSESSFWPGVGKILSQIFISNLNIPKILSVLRDITFWSWPSCTNTYKQMELLLWIDVVTLMTKWSYLYKYVVNFNNKRVPLLEKKMRLLL